MKSKHEKQCDALFRLERRRDQMATKLVELVAGRVKIARNSGPYQRDYVQRRDDHIAITQKNLAKIDVEIRSVKSAINRG